MAKVISGDSLKIDKVYSDFLKYENFVKKSKGLQIHFNDIFLPNTYNLIKKLESYLGVNPEKIDWKSEQYGLIR